MTTPELTSRILTGLLRRQAADTDQLLALLSKEQPTSPQLLDDRLQALHDQQLVARFDGVWLLTDDGLAVARSDAGAFEIGMGTPITAAAAPGRGARTEAVTSLALSFLRAHRAAFGDAPFEWESEPRLRSRDDAGRCQEIHPKAAVKTFTNGPRGLEPVRALVDVWPEQAESAVAERLGLYAGLVAAEHDHSAKAPWRRWLGRAPLLLIAVPAGPALGAVRHAFREAAGADSRVQRLIDSVPIGVAAIDAVAEAGVEAALWWSPVDGITQVWRMLRCGMESAQEVSCAISACHLTG
ncbi:hypothetical protein [Streptacidiphilus neutrinimicus]|uniref:hypothetical protein n=1 Tax=Streptacidiphilus neutrinimicus TaxID=105420 RepID=UPI0005A79F54|nr:hypothetical protein [Streptacidiphilus neutrinimicus]